MLIYTAFRNLFRNVRRTIAVLLTVALGSGALFCFKGFINGVLEDYRESTIHSHHGNGQINMKGYRDTVFEKPWDHWIDTGKQVEEYVSTMDGVQAVFPRVTVSGMLSSSKANITGQGQGVEAEREAAFFDSLNIEEGEALTSQSEGILLGRGLAKALAVHPGDSITLYTRSAEGGIGKAKLKVTGIFHTGLVDFDSRVFRIQLKKAQSLLGTDKIESISIGLKDHAHWSEVAAKVERAFSYLEANSFDILDKVYYQHSVDWLQAQFYIVQMIILSIVLLGIFNTISAAILERKQEIGNLRANGESVKDVLALISCEGALLGIAGSLIGLGLTLLIAKGILQDNVLMPPGPGSTRQFTLGFSFHWTMVASSLILSILSAIGASIMAGLKIARMPISKALRAY